MSEEFWGIIYKITDITDGKYYIGLCRSKKSWQNGYLGSGERWNNHLKKHKKHRYKREILENNIKNKTELYSKEVYWINKFFDDPDCYNLKNTPQGDYIPPKSCEECGYNSGKHAASCSKFNPKNKCSECGGLYGRHKENCSSFDLANKCTECGCRSGQHKKDCSHYKQKGVTCPECGGKCSKHKKDCSKFKRPKGCRYCGSLNQYHRNNCPNKNKDIKK